MFYWGDNMINILYNILMFLYDGVITLIDIIINIPTFINKAIEYLTFVNIMNNPIINSILITIVAVCVAIRIKRLII